MARLHKTLTDYVVIAISPALIMALIGSLVFFLTDVFYQGSHQTRLHFIFGLFVMATVLIGRISIDEGREYAALFALPLAGVTLLAVFKFVEYSGPLAGLRTPLNIGLIALIWWCADRLTWDCTVIDERQDASGEGLLQTVGLERGATATAHRPGPPQDLEATSGRELPQAAKPQNWWERFVAYRRRPHAPGVWVIYFSLAALPLFGLGQWFIQTQDLERRRHAFWMLCAYVASGLGLLMTTSFLGLRRYLRQRQLEMPLEMAGVWLGVGSLMIVALLIVCDLLPRPSPEYSITQVSFQLRSPENLQASRYAAGKDGAKPGEQPAHNVVQQRQPGADGPPQKDSGSQTPAPGSEGNAESGGTEQGNRTGSGGPPKPSEGPDQASGGGKNDQQGSAPDKPQSPDHPQGASPGSAATANRPAASEQSSVPSQEPAGKAPDASSEAPRPSPSESKPASSAASPSKSEPPAESQADPGDRQQAASSPPSSFQPMQAVNSVLGVVPHLLQWLYRLIFVAIAVYLAWKYRDRVLPAVMNFWRNLQEIWASLFGGRRGRLEVAAVAAAEPAPPPPRPFQDFADPFVTGTADRYPPRELVAYSFAALEAWSRERGCPRGSEQTPHEFVQRLGSCDVTVAAEARNLADLYCRAAYSQQSLAAEHVAGLRRLWQTLRATAA